MASLAQPVKYPLTILRGTDHEWSFRRVTDLGVPIIPTVAQAQVRNRAGGTLWVELTAVINNSTGWITLTLPLAATAGAEWDARKAGAWDLEVVVGGKRLRWVEGNVKVSQDVTRG